MTSEGETQRNDPSVSINSPPPTQSPTQLDNEPLSVTASIQEGSVNINSNPTSPPNDELNVPRKSKRGRKRKPRKEIVESDSDIDDDIGFPASKLFEYQWPLVGPDIEWCVLQEQVAEYLDIRGMGRRYPDLERRNVDVEEKKYLLDTGVVTETQINMGLVALRSDEVMEMMADEFPVKYKDYLDSLTERQVQNAIDESIADNKRLAESQVTQDPPDKDLLHQQMLQEAVKYNKKCLEQQKQNHKQCVDKQTNIHLVPRPLMKPQESINKGRYPVALLPGQYCDYVQRYTPEQLLQLPLSTATKLSIPLNDNSTH